MANKTRRVRCLICNKLVARQCDPFEPQEPYAVIPLHIGNKVGCVCADCVEYYSQQDPYEPWINSTNNNDSTHESDSDKEQPENKKNDTQNSEKTDHSSNDQEKKNIEENNVHSESTVETPESSSKEDLSELIAKYRCLDYSLDSLSALVKKTVFGQKDAVEKVVYSLYINQLVNMLEESGVSFDNLNSGGAPGFKRRHIMLIGDTGVGKTLLATTAPKVMGLLHSVSNATPLTSSGYVGEDVIAVVERLYAASGNNIERAQNGIIILDEIDKKKREKTTNGKDVTGTSVQQELLKLLEPSTVWINKHTTPFYTGNLTIIMMGAFVGLDEIIEKRTSPKRIGFNSEPITKNDTPEVLPEDLIEYGFIPEFVARVPCICRLNKLTVDVAIDIIYGVLEKYDILFKAKDFKFIFNPFLIANIAEKVVKSSMGARNVETLLDKILQPALWKVLQSLPGGTCEILEDGSAEITRASIKNPKETEIITTPKIPGYEIIEDELESMI